MTTLEERLDHTVRLLQEISRDFQPAVLANGFGPESMVLTDLIARHGLAIDIFSLDTGRLPEQTHELAQNVRKRYGLTIRMLSPDPVELESWVAEHGTNAFYQSPHRRAECYRIRKVRPLAHALTGKCAWITGLRREQAPSCSHMDERGWDSNHDLYKFNPMVDWSQDELWAYIRTHAVLYNALHDRGYPASAARPARGRSRRARVPVPVVGGGSATK